MWPYFVCLFLVALDFVVVVVLGFFKVGIVGTVVMIPIIILILLLVLILLII